MLPAGTRFEVPSSGKKKYVAVIPTANGRTLRVSFGHRDYQHYRDRVPPELGGGKWRRLDHNDEDRRQSYRQRAAGQKCADGERCIARLYSPAWFSYYYLW